jgi:methylated-DNA-[protein]-cysteine S-methyltransferase
MDQIQYQFKSKIGPLYLVASQKSLQGVFFDKQPTKLIKKLDPSKPEQKILGQAARQLEEYFSGQRKKFDFTFDLSGTAFQRQVWGELSKIPYGKTVSYRDIAQRIRNPKAVRAVGSANGKNPVCIMIPCHRVIAADGSIGGYSGGLDIKRKLLKLEGNS